MGSSQLLQVIGSSLALGIVHVVTGPDHLSALSTLAVGKPLKTAFGLGFRWGCGHSFGLLVVAIIFFALDQSLDLDGIGYWADMFVGIFMILLGGWYMAKASKERMQYLDDKGGADHSDLDLEQTEMGQRGTTTNHETVPSAKSTSISIETEGGKEAENTTKSDDASKSKESESDLSGRSKWMVRIAAIFAGIFQGVAGPGGVLGVLVALKLNNWLLSSLYLALFFVSSIVTMGLYAIMYGLCTQRLTVCASNKRKCAFILKFVSAVLSLIVGVLWLTLSLTGTLDQLFH